MIKPIEEADLMDDIFMNLIAADPDIGENFCRTLLSVLLQLEIGKIKVHAQRFIPGSSINLRGVRLDVEVEEPAPGETDRSVNVYDIEPHIGNEENLLRMLRFRQAKIDSRYMKAGDNDFSNLPDLYVIYITDYDVFGEDYMMYTVKNKCLELPQMEYDDGLKYLFFYTKGTKGGSDSIGNMLKYMQNSREKCVVDEATKVIDMYVRDARRNADIRGNYMTFGDKIDAEKKASYEQGLEQGVALLSEAIRRIKSGSSVEDLINDGVDEEVAHKAEMLVK